MGLSLINRFCTILWFCFFLFVIIIVIGSIICPIISKDEIFISMGLFQGRWIPSGSHRLFRIFLFKLRGVVSISIGISNRKVVGSCISTRMLCCIDLIFFISFNVFRLGTLIIWIRDRLLSNPNGKWALRSSLTNYFLLFREFMISYINTEFAYLFKVTNINPDNKQTDLTQLIHHL